MRGKDNIVQQKPLIGMRSRRGRGLLGLVHLKNTSVGCNTAQHPAYIDDLNGHDDRYDDENDEDDDEANPTLFPGTAS
jgi:hypothetical protein